MHEDATHRCHTQATHTRRANFRKPSPRGSSSHALLRRTQTTVKVDGYAHSQSLDRNFVLCSVLCVWKTSLA